MWNILAHLIAAHADTSLEDKITDKTDSSHISLRREMGKACVVEVQLYLHDGTP